MPYADVPGMAGKRLKKDLSGMPYAESGESRGSNGILLFLDFVRQDGWTALPKQ